jgi:two-component system, NarL family, response regulator YdfI
MRRGSNECGRHESRVIRVVLAARSDSLRRVLETAIRSSPSLEFAASVDPGELASAEISGDVLLMEAGDADQDWQALADLPIPVVLLTDPADSALIGSALRTGIRGAISPEASLEEIESAIIAAHAGLVVMTPAAIGDLIPQPQFTNEPIESLTEREMEVLDLVAGGLSNKLIAFRLNISEHTVKTHVASIFAKLGVSSRTEALSLAIRRGLVML